jgi:aminopeptidase N
VTAAAYRVLHYDLDIDYRVPANRLDGRATLTVEVLDATDRLRFELAGLAVDKVTVDDRRAAWRHRGDQLEIRLAATARRGRRLQVAVRYGGRPRPRRGFYGEVGWEELHDGVIVAAQPDGAPTWFPCRDDPAEKAAYRIAVTTESPYLVVASGVLARRRVRSSTTTWVFEQVEPMATYLATVQIGRYERIPVAAGPVPQDVVAPRRLQRRALAHVARQPEMMAAFTEWFGPYPFAAYTMVVTDDDLDIPIEAQGMSVFGANHVDGRRPVERLVAHELAHQWFGNSVTPAEWRDVWLNEGFACYAEWLWSEHAGGPTADACARQWWARVAAQPQDLVLADPGPRRLFDDRVYKRGALCLHALRRTIGDDRFFTLLRAWTGGHRHAVATTDDFVARAAESAGDPVAVEGLLGRWLHRPALPSLPAAGSPLADDDVADEDDSAESA